MHQLRFIPTDIQTNIHLEAFMENATFSANQSRTAPLSVPIAIPGTGARTTQNPSAIEKGRMISKYRGAKNASGLSQETMSFKSEQYEGQGNYQDCELNEPRLRMESHGCVVSQLTQITYCQFDHFRIDVEKVHSVRGGENLTTVMGQKEKVEVPVYTKGAFQTTTLPNIPTTGLNQSNMYYIHDVIKAMETKDPQRCATTIQGTTMFITRYEYCNLYHTMTDWWNMFLALPPYARESAKSIHMVFLDAHPKGNLDAVWGAIFANVTYVQHLPSGGVCFEKAVLIPPGYMAHLWTRNRQFRMAKRCPSMTDAFVQFMVASHDLGHVKMIPGLVILIDRIPYIAHPRSNPAKAERILQNMPRVRDMVAAHTNATEVRLVQFETMTFREQLELIRSTHVMIGNHGAGIAHLIFLQDGAHVLEFQQTASEMMKDFSAWKPAITHTLLPSIYSKSVSKKFVMNDLVPSVKNALDGMIANE
jgi:glycoprotein 2-beta-D-xylosyltransferase